MYLTKCTLPYKQILRDFNTWLLWKIGSSEFRSRRSLSPGDSRHSLTQNGIPFLCIPFRCLPRKKALWLDLPEIFFDLKTSTRQKIFPGQWYQPPTFILLFYHNYFHPLLKIIPFCPYSGIVPPDVCKKRNIKKLYLIFLHHPKLYLHDKFWHHCTYRFLYRLNFTQNLLFFNKGLFSYILQ